MFIMQQKEHIVSFIPWDSSFESGIHEFDEHHKHLVNLLNITYDGFTGEADHTDLAAVLDELVDYATYHFIAEEHWMEVHNYPRLPQHREEHFNFTCRILELQKEYHASMSNLSLDVLLFLQDWLITHILKSDADYGLFAKGLPDDTH
jgi:hemerythrin